MHVADDDRLHLRWLDADRFQPFPYRLDHLALAFSAHGGIEAGVDNDRTGRADNRPNIEVERLQHVVRVAADEVLRRFAIVVPVSNGIDLMRVVAHSFSPSGISRKSYARGAERRVNARHEALLRQRGAKALRSDLDAGTALDRLHHGGEILVRPVLVARHLQDASDGLGDLHRHAEGLALTKTQLEVLGHQSHGETEIEGAGQHDAAEFVLGCGVAAGPGIDDVEHDARVEPRLDPHDHRFRSCGHGGGGQEVVAQLHRLAGARALADEEHPPDRGKRRLDRGDLRARTRRHQGERPLRGPGHSAAYRAVDLHDAFFLEQLEDALGHDCASGREIDEAMYTLAFDDTALSGRDLKH